MALPIYQAQSLPKVRKLFCAIRNLVRFDSVLEPEETASVRRRQGQRQQPLWVEEPEKLWRAGGGVGHDVLPADDDWGHWRLVCGATKRKQIGGGLPACSR